jgi:hypothetical protein
MDESEFSDLMDWTSEGFFDPVYEQQLVDEYLLLLEEEEEEV